LLVRSALGNDLSKLNLIGLIGCAILLGTAQAHATTYTYTGNNFTTITDNTDPTGAYTTSMSVTGSFTVANPLPNFFSGLITPTSFSFSDGRNTITNSNAGIAGTFFDVFTNGTGAVINWDISVTMPNTNFVTGLGPTDQIQTQNTVSFPPPLLLPMVVQSDIGSIDDCTASVIDTTSFTTRCIQDSKDSGEVDGNPGTWAIGATAAATPLPAALPLFATGIGALGLLGWRRKRKARAAI
jgi:hypothetical protein